MKKDEIVAHIIMEQVSDPVPLKNIDIKSVGDGLTYARFPARLQSFNVGNRNGRQYEGNCMLNGLNSSYIKEMIERGTWCCEMGHPITKDPARICTIDPKLVGARITSIDANYNGVNGWAETLLNNHGNDLTKLILQGFTPAFSLRALANITRSGGKQIVKNGIRIVCYDVVILPSHLDAYMDTNIGPQFKSIKESLLQEGNDLTIGSNSLDPVLESQFISVLESESINLKQTIEQQEIVYESMQISKDMKHVILEECGRTFIVKLEDKISHDIMNYMDNF